MDKPATALLFLLLLLVALGYRLIFDASRQLALADFQAFPTWERLDTTAPAHAQQT